MAAIDPLDRADLAGQEGVLALVEAAMGFVPRSMLTMARAPGLLEGFAGLAGAVSGMGQIDRGLAQLVANMVSNVAGCRYCQAHTGAHANRAGVEAAKVAAVWEFESSDRFDEAERAALRLARDAGQVPNAVTEAHFTELARHYTEDQILQLVATIALFGFLNRWNDTMATTLEDEPAAFAAQHLTPVGWEAGKHAHTDQD